MCLCSEIQDEFTQPSNNQEELAKRLEAIFTQLYDLVSNNEQLMPYLPFTLQRKRKSAPLSSTQSKPSRFERCLVNVYKYDPADYHVQTLFHLKFDIWDKDISSFFTHQQPHIAHDTNNQQFKIILNCLQIQQIDTHSRILRRFYCVALHRCRTICSQSDDAKTIAREIFPIHHPDKSLEEAGGAMKSLVKTIEGLILAGLRYEHIAKRLGVGSLFLLGDTVAPTIWEGALPYDSPYFEKAMSHLKSKGIVDLGERYEELANKIFKYLEDILPKLQHVWISQDVAARNSWKRKSDLQLNQTSQKKKRTSRNSLDDSEDCSETELIVSNHNAKLSDQLGVSSSGNGQSRQDFTTSLSHPGAFSTTTCVRAPSAYPVASNSNHIAISTLLNTTEVLKASGKDDTANGQSEIWDNRGGSSDFASQARGLHGKQRCVDSSFSLPKNGVAHGQEGPIGNSPSGNADISAVSQTEGARQPIDAIEEYAINGRIPTANKQRKIQFVYSDPKEEKINTNLQEPFRSPVMARLQSGLPNHQKCIMAMFPQDWKQDVTFSFTFEREAGRDMIGKLGLQCLPQDQLSQVQYYSNMLKTDLHRLGDVFHNAIISTGSYKSTAGLRCGCVSAFTFDGINDDFTFSIMVDQDSGWELINTFGLKEIDTSF